MSIVNYRREELKKLLIERQPLLPVIASRCGLTLPQLEALARHPQYKTKEVEINGKHRVFHLASNTLALVQREIASLPFTVHGAAHGYVRGRSIITNAACHVGAKTIVQFDLKDFFSSVSLEAIRHAFELLGILPAELATLVKLVTTREGVLPQGAPASPMIANAVLYDFDSLLSRKALYFTPRVVYTRYVDDLAFSGDLNTQQARELVSVVGQCIREQGYRLSDKTKIRRYYQRQLVVGVLVNNETMRVPREVRRRVRAALHRHSRGLVPGDEQARVRESETLRGWVEYVRMVNVEDGDRLRLQFVAATK
jgi:RNA-directed DNA polymerase